MKRNLGLLVFGVALLLLSGCAPGVNALVRTPGAHGVAGFWAGLWHGFILPVTFVISLFYRGVQMYEVHNSGGWYNFGFLLGASASLGGAGRGSSSKRK